MLKDSGPLDEGIDKNTVKAGKAHSIRALGYLSPPVTFKCKEGKFLGLVCTKQVHCRVNYKFKCDNMPAINLHFSFALYNHLKSISKTKAM